jgi:hypothetical protein
LGEDNGDTASSHQVSHAVHTGPLEACATLASVLHFLKNLVAFAAGVGSKTSDVQWVYTNRSAK